jgi:hypothetical protein
MNKSSPAITGFATLTAYQLEPLVRWALTGFKQPIPPEVPGIISAVTLMLVHGICNIIVTRMNKV